MMKQLLSRQFLNISCSTTKIVLKPFYYTLLLCIAFLLLSPARTFAKNNTLFAVNINEELQRIRQDIEQAEGYIQENKFQNVRSVLRLMEHRFDKLQKKLSNVQQLKIQEDLNRIKTSMDTKIDKLIQHNLSILRTEGVDSAISYLRYDMRMYGIPEEKLDIVGKVIMEEAPKVRQRQKQKKIDAAVHKLKSGATIDPNIDPEILSTAQRIYRKQLDSLRAIEEEKIQKQKTKETKRRAELEKKNVTHKKQQTNLNNYNPKRPSAATSDTQVQSHKPFNRNKAERLVNTIYTYIEQGKTNRAKTLFKNKRTFLSQNLSNDVLMVLEQTITQSSKKNKEI